MGCGGKQTRPVFGLLRVRFVVCDCVGSVLCTKPLDSPMQLKNLKQLGACQEFLIFLFSEKKPNPHHCLISSLAESKIGRLGHNSR